MLLDDELGGAQSLLALGVFLSQRGVERQGEGDLDHENEHDLRFLGSSQPAREFRRSLGREVGRHRDENAVQGRDRVARLDHGKRRRRRDRKHPGKERDHKDGEKNRNPDSKRTENGPSASRPGC